MCLLISHQFCLSPVYLLYPWGMQLTSNFYCPTCLPPRSLNSTLFPVNINIYRSPSRISRPSFNLLLFSYSSMAPAAIVHHPAKTVCVMDSSSRLGCALVDRLLHRGYTVHAAAFGRGDATKAAWSDNKRVRVFRADPLDYHSIAGAIRGCSGLFYTFGDESSYDEFMVEIELRAAHNVLEACAQADAMERVVFTSSVTAVIWNDKLKIGQDFDERDWSDPAFCRKFKLWHALAKTLSEKTAWALAMDRGVDMVAVNAGLILAGPELLPLTPYLKGAPEMYEDGVLVTVKLQFLVDAHICIFECPVAYGRYLCFNHTICNPEDAIKLAQMLSPGSSPPPSDGLRVFQERIHSKKLNKLKLEYADGLQVAD